MKTITKALRTLWDVTIGLCIGILIMLAAVFASVMTVIFDADGRKTLNKFLDRIDRKYDHNRDYTEIR